MTIHRTLLIPLIAVAWALFGAQARAQHVAEGPRCKPVSERTGELGCWIMTDQALGQLGKSEVFWHLDVYPTRADAERAKGARGTIVESLGKVWLLTIEDKGWRPSGGERVAEIGPLPINAANVPASQSRKLQPAGGRMKRFAAALPLLAALRAAYRPRRLLALM